MNITFVRARRIKTSVSLSVGMLKQIKSIAREQDRSVSNVLERFIRRCVKEADKGNRKPGGSVRL